MYHAGIFQHNIMAIITQSTSDTKAKKASQVANNGTSKPIGPKIAKPGPNVDPNSERIFAKTWVKRRKALEMLADL